MTVALVRRCPLYVGCVAVSAEIYIEAGHDMLDVMGYCLIVLIMAFFGFMIIYDIDIHLVPSRMEEGA